MPRTLLSEEMWKKIQPLLPRETGYWGRSSAPHRKMIEGILWIFRNWRALEGFAS